MRKVPFQGYCSAGCGNPVFAISKNAKYCSRACASKRFEMKRGCCAQCGARLRRKQSKYCSNRCQRDYEFAARSRLLESGNYSVEASSVFLRHYLRQKIGERCSRCGWAERHPKTGIVPVEVEHIDGDYRNNHPDNLTLLCPNCHSLTDTFRALNRGRGRPMRLGGRSNPISTAQPKDSGALRPNTSMRADVAERLNAPDL